MNKITYDVRYWIGDGRTIRGLPYGDNGGAGLVRVLLQDFREAYPEHTEQMELLQVIASVCGFDDPIRMLGSAVCESDGSRTLTLKSV